MLMIFCCCCYFDRIYLSYHTMSQIVCGVAAGCVMAMLWFLLVHLILTPLFPGICAWLVHVSLYVLGTSLHYSILLIVGEFQNFCC